MSVKDWLSKHKWYLLHAAAVVAGFLNPSVRAFLAAHANVSSIGALAWGWILHYLDGK